MGPPFGGGWGPRGGWGCPGRGASGSGRPGGPAAPSRVSADVPALADRPGFPLRGGWAGLARRVAAVWSRLPVAPTGVRARRGPGRPGPGRRAAGTPGPGRRGRRRPGVAPRPTAAVGGVGVLAAAPARAGPVIAPGPCRPPFGTTPDPPL